MKNRKIHHIWSVGIAASILISSLGIGSGNDQTKVQAQEQPQNTVAVLPESSPTSTTEASPSTQSNKTSAPKETVQPTAKVKKWKKVSGVKLFRYSTHVVKVTWNKHKKANYYRVYYAKKNGKYHLAGVTKNTHLLVKKLKNRTTYSFYVQACKKKKLSPSDSVPSKKRQMKMKTYKRKIVFAGDSICEGVGYGQAFPQMHSSAKKKTVAYRGLNTVTFHTKRIFNGRTGLQKLVAERPYRVYMMIGMNEIHYRKTSLMIAEYKDMINYIRQVSPNTDIVLCAVSPVTRAERARHTGMKQIPIFNKKLKKLAKKVHANYLDYTDFLKDSGGYLKAQYAAGDGYHWKNPAYTQFGKVVGKYDKALDH